MYIQLEADTCIFGGEMGHPTLSLIRTMGLVLAIGAVAVCCGSRKDKPDSVAADGRGGLDLLGDLGEVGADRSDEGLEVRALDKPRLDVQEVTCDLCIPEQLMCDGKHSYRACEIDDDGCWVWGDWHACLGDFHVCACSLVDRETCYVMTEDDYCICLPQCEGKSCGPDGCGGECPPGCSPYGMCFASGQCQEPCGDCGLVLPCLQGETICDGTQVRHCVDVWADSDDCEGECWTFGEAEDCPEPNQVCSDDKCGCDMAQCEEGVCFEGVCHKGLGCEETGTPGCQGCECQECVCSLDPTCCLFGWADACVQNCVELCGGCPKLEGCGDGVCGQWDFENCATCPEDCGCADGWVCNEAVCCAPVCDGKECGDDLCGGACGQCAAGFTCNDGACLEYGGPPDCNGYEEPSASDCGGTTYHGCCDEYGRALWCNDDALYCVECLAGGSECGWNPAWEVYQCGGEADEGPTEFSKECSW